jgi:hypothetical protein
MGTGETFLQLFESSIQVSSFMFNFPFQKETDILCTIAMTTCSSSIYSHITGPSTLSVHSGFVLTGSTPLRSHSSCPETLLSLTVELQNQWDYSCFHSLSLLWGKYPCVPVKCIFILLCCKLLHFLFLSLETWNCIINHIEVLKSVLTTAFYPSEEGFSKLKQYQVHISQTEKSHNNILQK